MCVCVCVINMICALNNLQGLLCHKTNQNFPILLFYSNSVTFLFDNIYWNNLDFSDAHDVHFIFQNFMHS